jgi:hypothetical protein
MTGPKFCGHCGAPLGEGLRFCGQCGQAVAAPGAQEARPGAQAASPAPPPIVHVAPLGPPPPAAVVPPPVAPPPIDEAPPWPIHAASEPILGIVLGVQRRHGFLGLKVDSYNVVVTSERLIFAAMPSSVMKDAVNRARTEAKAQGKGFFGVASAQMGWMQLVRADLEAMSPDQILRGYAGSFQLSPGEVRRIRFTEKSDDESGQTQRFMTVESAAGKCKYHLQATGIREAAEALSQLVPQAVR